MRQQAGCTGHVALCHQAADDGGADLFGVHVAFADFHDLQSKAVAAQIVVTALLVAPEAVVEAHDQRFGADAPHEVVADERVGRKGAECLVERDDDQVVDALLSEQVNLLFERGQQPQAVGPAERHAGMGFEREYDALAALCAGPPGNGAQQGQVSAVHAVVRSDGDRRTDEMRECIEPVKTRMSACPAAGRCSVRSPCMSRLPVSPPSAAFFPSSRIMRCCCCFLRSP